MAIDYTIDTHIGQLSDHRVVTHRNYDTARMVLFCTTCFAKITVDDGFMWGDPIQHVVKTFCANHRHDKPEEQEAKVKKMNGAIGNGFSMGLGAIGANTINSSTTYEEKTEDPSTELVLAVAKASNFKVNAQGRRVRYGNRYRLFCNECKAEFDLGDRFPDKAEIENPTTESSKFCVTHAHKPCVKMVDGNYRKFRDE